jgi:hypothetical protein
MSAPTKSERLYWSRLVDVIGCIACYIDGNPTNHCSIHHLDGRTKHGSHRRVLPLCAGHHQHGTGNDKTMIAVHPYKRRFEDRYGKQEYLNAKCNEILAQHGLLD